MLTRTGNKLCCQVTAPFMHASAGKSFRHVRKTNRCSSFSALQVASYVFFCLAWWGLEPAQAVILLSTDDPNYNTTEPTGRLAGSGWQYEGFWGSFLGTPIA